MPERIIIWSTEYFFPNILPLWEIFKIVPITIINSHDFKNPQNIKKHPFERFFRETHRLC